MIKSRILVNVERKLPQNCLPHVQILCSQINLPIQGYLKFFCRFWLKLPIIIEVNWPHFNQHQYWRLIFSALHSISQTDRWWPFCNFHFCSGIPPTHLPRYSKRQHVWMRSSHRWNVQVLRMRNYFRQLLARGSYPIYNDILVCELHNTAVNSISIVVHYTYTDTQTHTPTDYAKWMVIPLSQHHLWSKTNDDRTEAHKKFSNMHYSITWFCGLPRTIRIL